MEFGVDYLQMKEHSYERTEEIATFKTGWGPRLSGRLADYANASKGTLLLGDIQAHMIKEASRPSTRRQDVIHPSEMAKTGWCPRSTYERIKACRDASDAFLKPTERVGVQLLNIFDEGHYIHDKWQKRLRDMGDLWGDWLCESCGVKTRRALYPQKCWDCDSTLMSYAEVPMRYPKLTISGHADGAIPRLNALIEIKSVGVGTARIEAPDIYKANSEGQKIDLQGLWKSIKEPFPAHVKQGQLYLAICKQMELDFTKIIFLYESKFNQGAKEFVVDYDPSLSYPLLQAAESIVSALEGLTDPPKCPYDICKECEIYGTKKSDVTTGLGNSSEQSEVEGAQSSGTTIRRSARPTSRVIRPS
jgi:hypothetical protein